LNYSSRDGYHIPWATEVLGKNAPKRRGGKKQMKLSEVHRQNKE
jgi:hypothetical protein